MSKVFENGEDRLLVYMYIGVLSFLSVVCLLARIAYDDGDRSVAVVDIYWCHMVS